MKKNYLLADVQTEVEINVPANSIDLSKWVFEMSDKDYQKCAKGHIGAGSSIMPDGKRSSINVESVGGSLLFNIISKLFLNQTTFNWFQKGLICGYITFSIYM